jgi:predicted secreted Zn-dependent protease
MVHKPRSSNFVYLLCALVVTVAFSCRSLSPEPGLPPGEPTSVPAGIFPTKTVSPEIIPTENLSSEAPELTATGASGVTLTTENQYYEIIGNDAKELRKQLDKFGPHDPENGKVYDAIVEWHIKWNLYYQQGGSDCKIDRAEVLLSLTYRLPKWNPTAQAKPAVIEKWNNYLKKLMVHEDGHADLVKAGVQNIYQTIMDLPPVATCDALATAADVAAQQGVEAIKQDDKAYDKETSYGKTQDAVFP